MKNSIQITCKELLIFFPVTQNWRATIAMLRDYCCITDSSAVNRNSTAVYTSCSAGFLFAMTRTLLTSTSGTSRFRQRKCMWGQASKIYTRKSALLQIWHLMFLGRARVCSVHYSPYRLVMLTVLWYFWCVYLWRMNSSPCPELIPAWIAHTSRALPFVTSCSEPIETSIVHMQKAIIVPAYQRSFSSA